MGFSVEASSKHIETILSVPLAHRIKRLTSEFTDNTEIRSLRFPPIGMGPSAHWLYGYKNSEYPNGWEEFFVGLGRDQRNYLSSTLSQLVLGGVHTLGELRAKSAEELLEPKIPGKDESRLTREEAVFLKIAFAKPKMGGTAVSHLASRFNNTR